MRCKRIIIILIFTLSMFFSCVSKEEYDQKAREYDQCATENTQLREELEELKFGLPALFKKVNEFYKEKNFVSVKENIQFLIKKYPKAVETTKAKKLLPTVEDELAWQKLSEAPAVSSEEYEAYLKEFPRGKYKVKARKAIQKLKVNAKRQAYQEAKQANTSRAWERFLEDYPNHPEKKNIRERIIRLKVDEISGDSQTGQIPSFSQTSGYTNTSTSDVTIENDTGRTLIVRYSGPSVKEVSIVAGGSKTTHLKSGSYKVTASAGSLNYAGSEYLSGSYSSTYYIKTTRY